MILEYCAENFTNLPKAIAAGATRIELCDNLPAGGTTPSYGVIEKSVAHANAQGATVMTMIRPRGGNFVYTADEFDVMKKDLEIAKLLKSDGVVFGCLTTAHRVHREQVEKLVQMSGELETVFHMAFDEIAKEDALADMEWLIQQEVTRILTHGGRTGTIFDNVEWLRELIEYADDRIELVIGGGVTHENIKAISEELSINQFHGTRIVALEKK